MVLIAESGSTKCDWLLYAHGGEFIDRYKSMGFNPYFHDAKRVEHELNTHKDLAKLQDRVTHLLFFGAGCSSLSLNERVYSGLSKVFKNAHIKVDHDLSAAAFATYNGAPAISCILGTGSNSCFFDGNNIRKEVPSLAYILGDEGSGSFYGKKLLAAFFYKQLPQNMMEAFEQEYPSMDKDQLIEKVYRTNSANVFLASFMPFVVRFKSEAIVSGWIKEGIDLFLQNQVVCYPEHKSVPIHFVGSIASILRSPLEEALSDYDMKLGEIIAQPAEALAGYVFRHIIHQMDRK